MPTHDMSELVTRAILKEELQEELQKEFQKEREVTRAIVKEELQKEREETRAFVKQELLKEREVTRSIVKEELAKLSTDIDARFERFRGLIQQDTLSAVRMVLAESERSTQLALEPTKDVPGRVEALEQANLPARVTRLEAKVFPPKRASRRR